MRGRVVLHVGLRNARVLALSSLLGPEQVGPADWGAAASRGKEPPSRRVCVCVSARLSRLLLLPRVVIF